MTAVEQLAAWAAAPNDEIFVGVSMSSADTPRVAGRMKAGDAIGKLFPEKGTNPNSMPRDVLARFLKLEDVANSIRVGEIRGVTCVIVEAQAPFAPHALYRLILSPVEAFS